MSVHERQYLALRSFGGWGVSAPVRERGLTREMRAEDGWVLVDVDLVGLVVRREVREGPVVSTQARFITWECVDALDLVKPGPEDR